MITKIQITNIKGFGSTNNILDVELQPSKVNIVVAPNGFGKTSLTTAFKCVMKNSRRLEVEKDLKYYKDESKTSVFRITEERTTYVSDSIKNDIATHFNCQVISSLLKADTISKKIGTFINTDAYLDINSVVLRSVKTKPVIFYKVTEIRNYFGIKGKVLENIDACLENVTFIQGLSSYFDAFRKFEGKNRKKIINDIMTYVNGQTTSLDVIKRNVDLSIIKTDEYYSSFQNFFSKCFSGQTDWYVFSAFYQILYLYKNKNADLKQWIEAIEYKAFKEKLNQNLADFNSSWKENLKAVEHTKGQKTMLQVDFPHADELSNGQRDVMSFVVQLMDVQSKLKENKKNIVVIDEIFDYMDDANLITAQYYLTQYLKLNTNNLYVLILSHLDPTYFKNYIFSKSIINVCYLNKQALSLSDEMKAFLVYRGSLNRKQEDSNLLYKDISNYYFHYNPNSKDLIPQIHSSIPHLQKNWFKADNLKRYILGEMNKYLSGTTDYDPYSVCLAIRIRVEKLAYEKLTSQNTRDEFLNINKTKDKLLFVENQGIIIPDSFYVMGSIYNDAEHLNDPNKDKNCIYKLYHKVIKKLVQNFFAYDGTPIDISQL